MSYFILTLIFFLITFMLAYLTFRMLFKQSWFLAWLRGMSGISLLLLTLFCALFAFDIYSYRQITDEQNIATVSFSQLGDQYYTANITYAEGSSARYDLYGDQWQMDSRIIKWNSIFSIVGLKPGFRLDRLNGRYLSLEDERSKPRSVHEIHSSLTPVDFWQGVKWINLNAIVDARYGSSTYLPMVDGGQYQVNITHSGLIARALNETARQAIERWQ